MRLTSYSYSDGVPPVVSTTLNMLNQPTTITDAAGARSFTYNSNYRLANETNPVIVNGVMNYTYDAYGRRTGMNLTDGTVRAQAGYSYDTAGRVATVGDGGDTLTYAYAPGTGRVASTAWTTATGNNSAYTYDSYHRLTGIAVNNTPVYGYTLNDKNQRAAATLENGDNWAYTYDTLGQLTGALKKDSQDNTLNNMSYAFDLIGNRTSAVEDAANWTYASNLLNQYTQVNALLPTYDADGNMLTWNGWTYTWNGENRLASATNGNTRLEFDYDFLGRRIFKKVYTNNTLTEHRKFAYDGYKLIAEFDALNSNALLANYLWQPVGLDVPLRATIDGDARYFVADGNKNIIALKDATGATTDDYTYTPFGAVTASGSTDNPFRFSSEYHDAETGLVYYNYRYYNPVLGRWIKRDPIEEAGGIDLYGFVKNNSMNDWDSLGRLSRLLCYCSYMEVLKVFQDEISGFNTIPEINQLRGHDCDNGSFELLKALRRNPMASLGFSFDKIRRGKFLSPAKKSLKAFTFTVDNVRRSAVYVIWIRFVRLHSIVELYPKSDCKQYGYKNQILDFLLQSIYQPQLFYNEYPLSVSYDEPGYYEVEEPPNHNRLLPNQSTPYIKTSKAGEIFHGLTDNIYR